MRLAPVLTPHGVLTLRPSGDVAPLEPALGSRLEKAFAKGPGHALLCLGADEVGTVLPPELSYWREFGSRYVMALCALPSSSFAIRYWCDYRPQMIVALSMQTKRYEDFSSFLNS